MEGSTECPWGTARAWCQLLGHIGTSSKLANTMVVFYSLNHEGMV